jgi:hypothetical protein
VEDIDAEIDNIKGEEISMLRKRRKRIILRRKTDPKTGTPTLCQLWRLKCILAWEKNIRKVT